jgi:hypothetical protein
MAGSTGQYPKSTGFITLNGVRILGPLELNRYIPVLDWPMRLRANEQLGVELRGPTGSGISHRVIGVDLAAPAISAIMNPPPNDFHSPGIWFGTKVGGSNPFSPTIVFKYLNCISGFATTAL